MGALIASRESLWEAPLYSSLFQPSWAPCSSLEMFCFFSPLHLELARSCSSSHLSIKVTASKKPSWTPTFLPPSPCLGWVCHVLMVLCAHPMVNSAHHYNRISSSPSPSLGYSLRWPTPPSALFTYHCELSAYPRAWHPVIFDKWKTERTFPRGNVIL